MYVTSVGFLLALALFTPVKNQTLECHAATCNVFSTESFVLQRRGNNKDEKQGRQVYLEEMKKRWDGLSKEQKEQVYKQKQKEIDQKFATIDKLLELGITDESHATIQKKQIQNRFNEMKSAGEFPWRSFCMQRNN